MEKEIIKDASLVNEQDKAAAARLIQDMQTEMAGTANTVGKTLPQVNITKISQEAIDRANRIMTINKAVDPNQVIDGDTGKTLQDVINDFNSPASAEEAKHKFEVVEDDNGRVAVKVTPPAIGGVEQPSEMHYVTPPNVSSEVPMEMAVETPAEVVVVPETPVVDKVLEKTSFFTKPKNEEE